MLGEKGVGQPMEESDEHTYTGVYTYVTRYNAIILTCKINEENNDNKYNCAGVDEKRANEINSRARPRGSWGVQDALRDKRLLGLNHTLLL